METKVEEREAYEAPGISVSVLELEVGLAQTITTSTNQNPYNPGNTTGDDITANPGSDDDGSGYWGFD
ncbi:MAG: hypothetical protein LBN29_02135 [Mediterranea sp.]|nr:hypothetical protein [Mediterranea sp.]